MPAPDNLKPSLSSKGHIENVTLCTLSPMSLFQPPQKGQLNSVRVCVLKQEVKLETFQLKMSSIMLYPWASFHSVVDTLVELTVHIYLKHPRCCCTKLPTVHVDCLVLGCLSVGCVVQKWGGGCDLGSLLWLLLSLDRGTCVTREPLSIKHYIIWNGLVNCVQLLTMFYIFICLL